jgi:hypothetical protein
MKNYRACGSSFFQQGKYPAEKSTSCTDAHSRARKLRQQKNGKRNAVEAHFLGKGEPQDGKKFKENDQLL